jgi:hypothetical protein
MDVLIFINDSPIKPNTITLKCTLPLFIESQCKEINGLLKKGIFKFTNTVDIPKGVRIFNSWFVDKIKNARIDKAFKKSRLVI